VLAERNLHTEIAELLRGAEEARAGGGGGQGEKSAGHNTPAPAIQSAGPVGESMSDCVDQLFFAFSHVQPTIITPCRLPCRHDL
jgi:hypothetical protein